MSGFDFGNIPDYVLHDAVRQTLGSCNLIGGTGSREYSFIDPLCGGHKKHVHRKSGYIYFSKSEWSYVCYNCGRSMPFLSFLKEKDPVLYRQVIFHAFSGQPTRQKKEVVDNSTIADKTYKPSGPRVFKDGELITIFENNPLAHIALEFCKKRKIREEVYSRWFVCLKDQKFHDRKPTGEILLNDRGFPIGNEYGYRLIIPYYKFGGVWDQFDARDLREDSSLRYRNLKDAEREFYNIDWLDVSKPFYLLEGAVDASFIKNAVSFGGIKGLSELLRQHPEILIHKHNGTIIWDNDASGWDEIPKTVEMGMKWFNWSTVKPLPEFAFKPDGSRREIKDINDAVLYTNIFTRDEDEYIIESTILPFIENVEGSLIKVNLLYGDRRKMKFEKSKELMESLRIKEAESKAGENPFLKGLSPGLK